MTSLAEELALLHQVGIRVCVVHGGGKQLTELAEKMGSNRRSSKAAGVTDDDTLEMAKMIFAGKINTDILAALRHRGVHPRLVFLAWMETSFMPNGGRPNKSSIERPAKARGWTLAMSATS